MTERTKEDKSMSKIETKTIADFPDKENLLKEVLRVEEEAWPPEIRATEDKFRSRLDIFPDGFSLVLVDGKLAGVSTAEIIKMDLNNPPSSWEGVTDNGFIKNTHTKDGNALYVVSVGVSNWAQGKGLGSILVEAQKKLVKEKNLDFLVLGARLPGYGEYHKDHVDVSAEMYAKMLNDQNEPIDPEIRFYSRKGLKVQKIVPNYMEDDPESENFGVVMVWKNE